MFEVVSQATKFPGFCSSKICSVWGNVTLRSNETVWSFTPSSEKKSTKNQPRTQRMPTTADTKGTATFLGLFWNCVSSSRSDHLVEVGAYVKANPRCLLLCSTYLEINDLLW